MGPARRKVAKTPKVIETVGPYKCGKIEAPGVMSDPSFVYNGLQVPIGGYSLVPILTLRRISLTHGAEEIAYRINQRDFPPRRCWTLQIHLCEGGYSAKMLCINRSAATSQKHRELACGRRRLYAQHSACLQ